MSHRISVTITVTEDGFFTNASLDDQNFVCTGIQGTLDMSLASVMPYIRDYVSTISASQMTTASPPGSTGPARGLTIDSFQSVLDILNAGVSEGDSHSDRQTFIAGRGWVDLASISCIACGDSGRIPIEWSDEGDSENGPCLVETDWEYCHCPAGIREQHADQAQVEREWEARTRRLNR